MDEIVFSLLTMELMWRGRGVDQIRIDDLGCVLMRSAGQLLPVS